MKYLLFLFVLTSPLAFSLDKAKLDQLKKDLETRSGGLVSENFNRRLERATGEIAAENYKRAVELLESLVESTKSNRFENALALKYLGTSYIQSGNSTKGLSTLDKALKTNSLPYDQTMHLIYTLAQISMAEQKYDQAEERLEEWFYLTRVQTPDAYILKAAIYAEKKQYKKALEFAEQGLKIAKEPKESWLSFVAGLYLQNEQLAKAAEMFKQLTGIRPKEGRYWKQLSGIYMSLNKADDALTAMVLSQKMGLVTEESDIFTLCRLYNYNDIPINCARLLENALTDKSVKDLKRTHELLSQAYIQAREPLKAVPSLKYLASQSKDAKHESQIGFIHYNLHQWAKAIDAFDLALKKDFEKKETKADLLLSKGISEYQLKKYAAAIDTLSELKSIEDYTEQANAWLGEIEQKKAAAL